jgi:phosphatidate cytidylyltransferase
MAILAVVGVLEFIMLARGRATIGNPWVAMTVTAIVLAGFHREEPELWRAALLVGATTAFVLAMAQHLNPIRAGQQTLMTLVGVAYVGFPLAFLVAIRALENGALWLVLVLAATWGTDTFAYFGGVTWGKHKLAPRLSPKKTIEGAVIGVTCGFILALLFLIAGGEARAETVVMVALAPIIAVLGDLLESAIKRFFDVKDSHVPGLDLIPGHGGVLDRVDALLIVSAFCYFFLLAIDVMG